VCHSFSISSVLAFSDRGDAELSYNSLMILPGTGNSKLATEIASILGVRVGNIELKRFSDGEVKCDIKDNVRGRDVFIVQSCSGIYN